jgi:hypothetical protein
LGTALLMVKAPNSTTPSLLGQGVEASFVESPGEASYAFR